MCKFSPVLKQFIAILCCNLLTLSFGLISGWATINYNELQSENSTFATGPLNLEEASLVISILNVGGFLGNFAIVPISQLIGVKRTLHLLGPLLIVSTLLILYAKSVYYLYVSRFAAGFVSGAIIVGIPTLVNDISYDGVRGALNSLYDPSFNLGIIISFALGNYLSCLDQAKVQLIIPLIFMLAMFLLPESPEYWSNRNNEKRAMKSRKFYKGSIAALEKVDFIQVPNDDELENGKLNDVTDESKTNSKLTLQDFLTPQAKKAFFIAFTAFTLSFLSGTMTIVSYVTDIFVKTGSSFSAKNSSLFIAIIQISANLVLLNFVERVNRRTLYIWSSILATVSFLLLAAYCCLWIKKPEYEWMPPFCIACIVFISCMGLLPIPYIITIEIFPKKIRQTCLALAASTMWLILFVLAWIFPILLEKFGLFSCMIALAVMCSLNAVFGMFFIPETRGKSYEEIMELLS
ncbi:facilitated trehalose transporter Tret1-like [Sitodiplosis mosellana]|uniref:facilitated trehalose transporter Tret1-like n=1 Tax=Sitodiplosis mosellana TaxID=263140 RepID=UPI0024452FBE|nr:facilitated trehalose transporter Tret1-like [Sitodiplosis mosellana]